jgi:hypothetical protein
MGPVLSALGFRLGRCQLENLSVVITSILGSSQMTSKLCTQVVPLLSTLDALTLFVACVYS